MKIEEVLETAKEREINREEAMYLFQETRTYDKMLQLFQVACEVRDEEMGRIFQLHGHIASITPCTVNPPCSYCGRSSLSNNDTTWGELFGKELVLTLEEISASAKLIEETGTKAVDVFGGTVAGGDARRVIRVVKTIKDASDLEIMISAGPSFSRETLIELQKLGVKEVASSFETINERLFKEVKPGDSFEARKKLAETIDNLGLGLYTVLMVGLGGSYSYEDYADQMFYLKRFENLSCLTIARFNPVPGTPLENHPPPSPLETARTAAIARLVFRDIDIRMGGFDYIYLPLSLLSGANRAQAGASISKNGRMIREHLFGIKTRKIGDLVFFNPMPATTKFVREAGMEVG